MLQAGREGSFLSAVLVSAGTEEARVFTTNSQFSVRTLADRQFDQALLTCSVAGPGTTTRHTLLRAFLVLSFLTQQRRQPVVLATISQAIRLSATASGSWPKLNRAHPHHPAAFLPPSCRLPPGAFCLSPTCAVSPCLFAPFGSHPEGQQPSLCSDNAFHPGPNEWLPAMSRCIPPC